jgi:hypothetical protein
MRYIFEMQCPRCYAERQACGTKDRLPPVMNCTQCMIDNAAVTEFIIIKVHVFNDHDGIDMLHYINNQRSKNHDDH